MDLDFSLLNRHFVVVRSLTSQNIARTREREREIGREGDSQTQRAERAERMAAPLHFSALSCSTTGTNVVVGGVSQLNQTIQCKHPSSSPPSFTSANTGIRHTSIPHALHHKSSDLHHTTTDICWNLEEEVDIDAHFTVAFAPTWFNVGGFFAKLPGTLWGLITGNEDTIKEVEDDIEKAAEVAKKVAVTVDKMTDEIDLVANLVEDGAEKIEEYLENKSPSKGVLKMLEDDVGKKVKFIKATAQKIDDLTDKIDEVAHIVEDDANKVEALIDKLEDTRASIKQELAAAAKDIKDTSSDLKDSTKKISQTQKDDS